MENNKRNKIKIGNQMDLFIEDGYATLCEGTVNDRNRIIIDNSEIDALIAALQSIKK